jgi:hypothetical protein
MKKKLRNVFLLVVSTVLIFALSACSLNRDSRISTLRDAIGDTTEFTTEFQRFSDRFTATVGEDGRLRVSWTRRLSLGAGGVSEIEEVFAFALEFLNEIETYDKMTDEQKKAFNERKTVEIESSRSFGTTIIRIIRVEVMESETEGGETTLQHERIDFSIRNGKITEIDWLLEYFTEVLDIERGANDPIRYERFRRDYFVATLQF